MPEWPIAEVARATGLTSRALRHYEKIGLLQPSRVAHNGYRFYGDVEVARLYRILSLRALGLPLAAIRAALADEVSLAEAMRTHLARLEVQRDLMLSQIAEVRRTHSDVLKGSTVSIDEVFQNFDHREHEVEVRARWGDEVWLRSAERRAAMLPEEVLADGTHSRDVNAALRVAAYDGVDPASERFQELVGAHYAWVAEQWGGQTPTSETYAGLADMYVADERFATVYGGAENAAVIRVAMGVWINTHLPEHAD